MNRQQLLNEVISKHQIEEVAYRYCRAIDRCDEALLLSTFHDDGKVDMGVYKGPVKEFAQFVIPYMRDVLSVAIHRLTNTLIEVEGNFARAESYMPGFAIGDTEAGATDFPDIMRYLDIYERRDGQWKLAFRQLVMDWNAGFPATMAKDDIFATMNCGRRDGGDISYGWFNSPAGAK